MQKTRDKQKLIQEAIDRAVDNKEVAGVNLLVFQEQKEIYYAQGGYSDLETKRPMDRDTICHLYSQTKPITAAAAMLLMQDGLIDLNQSVGDFIDSFKSQKCLINGKVKKVPSDKHVRIIDLLNMTSGLVYPGLESAAERETTILFTEAIRRLDTKNQMSTLEFAERIGEFTLKFVPGSYFQYGTSADVLGAVIEKVTGMKYGEFLKERLFDPLEMQDTAFIVPKEKKDRMAGIYKIHRGQLRRLKDNHLLIRNDGGPNAFESGGAGLMSTLDDYMHFGQMLLNGGTYKGKEILTPATVHFLTHGCLTPMQQRAFDNWQGLEGHTYGNLMRVMKNPDQAVIIGHKGEYGWDGWLGAYFMNDPSTQTTMVMLTQMADYATGALTRKLRNIILS
ncbi:MAG: beta-lactamase family protein [Butyrivibrio sp.]|nr:beta-lactamase family protein [Butyrivibrio sp.]